MHTEGGKLLLRQVTARCKGKRAQLQGYAGNCQQKIERKELGLQPRRRPGRQQLASARVNQPNNAAINAANNAHCRTPGAADS